MKAFAPADGEGRNGVYLPGWDMMSLRLMSLILPSIKRISWRQQQLNIDARVGDMFEYEWPENHFDLIIISFMHFLPEDHDRFISLVRRSINPAGF